MALVLDDNPYFKYASINALSDNLLIEAFKMVKLGHGYGIGNYIITPDDLEYISEALRDRRLEVSC